jgi:uncharacterized protein
MKCFFALLFLIAIWDSGSQAFQALEVPVLRTHVTDLTNTLSLSQRQNLESQLLAFEDTTSVQIAVLLVSTLKGESLEDFSIFRWPRRIRSANARQTMVLSCSS